MRFVIDGDSGDVIYGWVAPDNPLSISKVYVTVEGRRVAEISASVVDPVVRGLGWHSTGQCGFEVTDAVVPGLAEIANLEVYDADTNILVHRRRPLPGLCSDRLVLINTSIHPEGALQAALYPYFRQSYFAIGTFSEQVLTSLFDTTTLRSCLMSGALIVPRYEPHISQGEAQSTMLVHDPYVEMASRLLWLRARADLAADPAQSWRLGGLVEAARFAGEADYLDSKGLKRFFRMLPEAAYRLLYNPLTRQLGTRSPEDRIMPANSIIAVEVLSRIGIVGHRDYFEAFAATVFDHLKIEAEPPSPPPIPLETLELADRLRPLRAAQDFLSFDTVMSDAVRDSVARNWSA